MAGGVFETVERCRGEEGMTILETATAIMVIAVVLAFSLPAASNSISGYKLRNAAEHIAQRLTGARALAMAKNKEAAISFNYTSGLYGYDFTPAGAPDGIPDTSDPDNPDTAYFAESLPDGIAMIYPNNSNIVVRFNSRGELPIGATEQSIKISNSSMSATVHVNLRGKVWVSVP